MQEPMIYMKRKTQIMKEVHKTAEEDPSRNSERELMVNNIEESGSKKIENLNVKVHRYPAASCLDSQVQGGCNFKTESEKRT